MSDLSLDKRNKEDSDSDDERAEIREDLKQMSFEDLMKLKEELGSKVYEEAIFGETRVKRNIVKDNYKRENKNRPREMTAKRPVPFISQHTKSNTETEIRDPRFDSKCGNYSSKIFRDNYEFLNEIRSKEIAELKKQFRQSKTEEEKTNIKFLIQRLENQNREERNRKKKEELLKDEQMQTKKAREEGKQPYYPKKKELKAKELVQKFTELKETGKLATHLKKQRKKNATKDRKKLNFN